VNAVDTSVVVAAASTWHDEHERVRSACGPDVRLPAHVAVETYAVLTRLPPPHRVSPGVAREWLARRFGHKPVLTLAAEAHAAFMDEAAASGVSGGGIYDALVAAIAQAAGATLLTIDRRAARTYEALGVAYRYLD
jgi:predicted nucleic acid-binding protein